MKSWAFLWSPWVLLSAGGCSPQDTHSEKPNVVLISIDSLRADRIGPAGHRPDFNPDFALTPALDFLAQEGVVFENAFSTTSWTLPAHVALMTGLNDMLHGVEDSSRRMDPLHTVLAERLRQQGWRTAGTYSGSYLDPRYGFSRGFEHYQSALPQDDRLDSLFQKEKAEMDRAQPNLEWTPERLAKLRKIVMRYDNSGERVTDHALSWLRSLKTNEPFFLFAHYFDAHHDYLPNTPERNLSKELDPLYTGTYTGKDWTEVALRRDANGLLLQPRDLAHVRALYDGEIHLVDRAIQRLFDFLMDQGLWENSIVVVTSDHGEEFFDHQGITHARTLYRESVQIPLLIRIPDSLLDPLKPGSRVQGLARIQDIAPTLMDFLGLDPLNSGDGRSLRPLMHGSPGGGGALTRLLTRTSTRAHLRDGWRDLDFSVHRAFQPLRANLPSSGVQEVELSWHPQTGAPAVLVFDLREDPLEMRPLPLADSRVHRALERFAEDFERTAVLASKIPRSPLAETLAPPKSSGEVAFLEGLGYFEETTEGVQTPLPRLGKLPSPRFR
ncbi:MAG: sulfatase [Planctomycetes bacterium]|nr:sulfatase [Planctomycetota bacterium]